MSRISHSVYVTKNSEQSRLILGISPEQGVPLCLQTYSTQSHQRVHFLHRILSPIYGLVSFPLYPIYLYLSLNTYSTIQLFTNLNMSPVPAENDSSSSAAMTHDNKAAPDSMAGQRNVEPIEDEWQDLNNEDRRLDISTDDEWVNCQEKVLHLPETSAAKLEPSNDQSVSSLSQEQQATMDLWNSYSPERKKQTQWGAALLGKQAEEEHLTDMVVSGLSWVDMEIGRQTVSMYLSDNGSDSARDSPQAKTLYLAENGAPTQKTRNQRQKDGGLHIWLHNQQTLQNLGRWFDLHAQHTDPAIEQTTVSALAGAMRHYASQHGNKTHTLCAHDSEGVGRGIVPCATVSSSPSGLRFTYGKHVIFDDSDDDC